MMRFQYPAELWQAGTNEVVVSFRDIPGCHTSGEDKAEALEEAQDALEEAIAGRINRGEDIPAPSTPLPGEHLVAMPTDMAVGGPCTSSATHVRNQNVRPEPLRWKAKRAGH